VRIQCAKSIFTRPRRSSRGWWAAANGEPFIIAKAGKPLVKVVPIDAPTTPRRLGFMRGAFTVPDDFDTVGQEEIEKLFGAD